VKEKKRNLFSITRDKQLPPLKAASCDISVEIPLFVLGK